MRAGLLGEHLSHSYSPLIHRALVGDRYTYELYERAPEDLATFISGREWDALNVTIPYKQAIMPLLDEISDEALRIGAVNTVTRLPDGRLRGDNTDYFGFFRTVKTAGMDLAGKKALVAGNGGASATAVTVLRDLGADVVVLARNDKPICGIAPEPFEAAYLRHTDAEVVVNCTPLGMYPKLCGESPLSLERLPHVRAVFDMIYNPARTALLQEADERGIPTYNGLCMLVAQAKRAAEIFLGVALPDESIAPVMEEIARQTQNIVLIGMPGCGKSTVARLLAETLGRPTVDTDAMVETQAGRPIPDIFATDGEAVFRQLETEAVRAAGMMSGAVIATGGGVVTQGRNLSPLSQNGKLVFIHRDLDLLSTDGRPLSASGRLAEMYQVRLPLYRAFADIEVDNDGTPEETVQKICSALGYPTRKDTTT